MKYLFIILMLFFVISCTSEETREFETASVDIVLSDTQKTDFTSTDTSFKVKVKSDKKGDFIIIARSSKNEVENKKILISKTAYTNVNSEVEVNLNPANLFENQNTLYIHFIISGTDFTEITELTQKLKLTL